MASCSSSNLGLGIRCGGNHDVVSNRFDRGGPCSLMICNDAVSRGRRGITSMAMTMEANTGLKKLEPINYREKGRTGVEKLDKWMRESVVDIVKNLPSAPLLVQVYNDGGGVANTRLKTEKAEEENWDVVKRKWEKGEAPLPNGVILVEELEDEEEDESEKQRKFDKIWGIMVQGRGKECRPACYLLKTCSVGSGLGMCCTHFCLVKVKGFRESAKTQLKNCWLLQTSLLSP